MIRGSAHGLERSSDPVNLQGHVRCCREKLVTGLISYLEQQS